MRINKFKYEIFNDDEYDNYKFSVSITNNRFTEVYHNNQVSKLFNINIEELVLKNNGIIKDEYFYFNKRKDAYSLIRELKIIENNNKDWFIPEDITDNIKNLVKVKKAYYYKHFNTLMIKSGKIDYTFDTGYKQVVACSYSNKLEDEYVEKVTNKEESMFKEKLNNYIFG